MVSDLPSVAELGHDLVEVAGSPATFADAVTRALTQPPSLREAEARRTLAARYDWSVKAEAFARLLKFADAGADTLAQSRRER